MNYSNSSMYILDRPFVLNLDKSGCCEKFFVCLLLLQSMKPWKSSLVSLVEIFARKGPNRFWMQIRCVDTGNLIF